MPLLFESSYDTMVGPVMPITVSNVDNNTTNASVKGLLDTGSTYCGVTRRIVDELGLEPVGVREMITPMGSTPTSLYFIGVNLPDDEVTRVLGATGCAPQQGFDMLIGRNVIRLGMLKITEKWFSLQVPPPHAT